MSFEEGRQRRERERKTGYRWILLLLFFFLCSGKVTAQAAETTLRIISTTDLHNQLSVEYYDNAGEKSKGSLAKASTLIKEARASLTTGASVTVDVGDTIYGYGSDYIYENYNDALQPMYAAMLEIGYDAITLGNHEFDYGFSYVKKQLDKSGLANICTVANVYDAITKNNIWNNYIMVTKQCKATDGKTYPVNVAIIGVTRPALSNYSSHTGELTTADMVQVVKTQAAKAKENGADVVLAIAHTGIGTEEPEELSENEGYAIAALSNVDAVMCGHLHQNFPSSDNSAKKYYDLADVDQKTGLVKGKPVIMIQDRGRGIGVADLSLKIAKNGSVSITGASSKIVYCTKDTEEDPTILQYKSLFDEQIKATYTESVASLADGESIQNYFGYLSDNAAMQLNNEAKIREGLLFQTERGNAYSDYPVIAVSAYKKAGSEGTDDYLSINGFFTMKDLLGIQSYNRDYVMIYKITGAQLREWLEWTASVYGYWDGASSFSDSKMSEFISSMGLQSVLSSLWIENWKNFTVFDGIEYEFNMSNAPKYNRYGELVSSTSSRVTKLTCNGQAVTDSMQFLLVAERGVVYNNPVVGSEILSQRVKNTRVYFVNQLKDYVTELGSYGSLTAAYDQNWNVTMNAGDNYLIRSTINSKETAQSQSWYNNVLDETTEYVYYQARFGNQAAADSSGPTLVVTSSNKVKTNRDITIVVQATDSSGVASLKYARGEYKADSDVWNTGDSYDITGQTSFTVTENATYTVLAKDAYGNASVKYVSVDNLDRSILQVPEVDSYTNKKTALSGYAEPFSTVYVEVGDVTYTAVADSSGSFSCEMPIQNSGVTVSVYAMDNSGRKSDKVEVTVTHAGPNYPTVNGLNNKSRYITGTLNDESYCQIFAVIGTKVYVSADGGREAYVESTKYSASKTIVETEYTQTDGNFSLKVAVQDRDKQIKVFSVDTIGRVSAVNQFTVTDAAPNKPTVYKVCDTESTIYGQVPSPVSGCAYTLNVQVGAEVYSGEADANGYFEVPVSNLSEGMSIVVTASDVVDGKTRTSAKTTSEVLSTKSYMGMYGYVVIDTPTDKVTTLTGRILHAGYSNVYMKIGSKRYTVPVDENREFKLELDGTLSAGTEVSAVIREKQGQLTDSLIVSVEKAPALMPTVLTETIYNSSTKVQILSEEKCTACVKIGGQTFTSDSPVYDEQYGGYLYEVKLKGISAKEDIVIYMLNSAGKSKKVNGTVKGKKPEIKALSKITYKKKKLTGRVGLYLSPESQETEVTAKTTGTKVYAKTGGKVYEAVVKKNGKFKVKFPKKMKSGKKIKVWGVNEFGGKGKVVVINVK
jgi:2',3'-cyclic-nucleotide 2'-phosphodiesterase/3'-nucleotidase